MDRSAPELERAYTLLQPYLAQEVSVQNYIDLNLVGAV